MATRDWLARAKAVAQVITLTPGGTIEVGDLFNVTINGKTVSYAATGTTVASVCTGLQAALAAVEDAEFTEITWTDETTHVEGTAVTAGVPFTVTVETTESNGGAADAQSFTLATPTAATGPNHWSDANNWSGGAVPVNSDTVTINLALGSILYGLDQSAVTVDELNIYSPADTANTIGLPKSNAAGYTEYRETELNIGATACKIDAVSPLIRINFGSVQTSTEVRRTGTSTETGVPAVNLVGSSSSNAFDVVSGSVGLAFFDGEVTAGATLTAGPNANIMCGDGCTITTIDSLSTLLSNGAFTTFNCGGGVATINGAPGATTIDVSGGVLLGQFSGTITNVLVGPGTLDCESDMTDRTFTNTTIRAGGVINDPHESITHTNKIAWNSTVRQLSAA